MQGSGGKPFGQEDDVGEVAGDFEDNGWVDTCWRRCGPAVEFGEDENAGL